MQMFYCIITLLPPAFIFAIGLVWKLAPPKYQGKGLAYRTAQTCASPEAWAFAHRHCARLWIRIGLILLILSSVLLAVFPDNRQDYFLWLIGGQMVMFCLSAFFVDMLLKGSFDEDGRPR